MKVIGERERKGEREGERECGVSFLIWFNFGGMRGYLNIFKNSVLFIELCDFWVVFYVCINVFSFLCVVKIEV